MKFIIKHSCINRIKVKTCFFNVGRSLTTKVFLNVLEKNLNSRSGKSIKTRVTEKHLLLMKNILEKLVDKYLLSLIKKFNIYDDRKTEQCVSAKVIEFIVVVCLLNWIYETHNEESANFNQTVTWRTELYYNQKNFWC